MNEFAHDACHACPCVHGYLRKAVGLLDNSRDLARMAHVLLNEGADYADVAAASAALLRAGVMRVEATDQVRDAYLTLQETVPA
jgi:hypothetical protein